MTETFTVQHDRMALSLPEAAVLLGVSQWTIARLVKRGEAIVPGVEAFKVGSRWRVSKVMLERYLAGETVTS